MNHSNLCRYCDKPCMKHGFRICSQHYVQIFGDPNTGSPGTFPKKPKAIR